MVNIEPISTQLTIEYYLIFSSMISLNHNRVAKVEALVLDLVYPIIPISYSYPEILDYSLMPC